MLKIKQNSLNNLKIILFSNTNKLYQNNYLFNYNSYSKDKRPYLIPKVVNQSLIKNSKHILEDQITNKKIFHLLHPTNVDYNTKLETNKTLERPREQSFKFLFMLLFCPVLLIFYYPPIFFGVFGALILISIADALFPCDNCNKRKK